MAVKASDIANTYPIPVYRFVVSVGGESMSFSEVSGLDIAYETITYKHGLGKIHMPGQQSDINITLKRGLVKKQTQFYDWIHSISLNQVDKRDITVSLTDATGQKPVVTWSVSNAFPKKLAAPSFNGGSNEVSVEQLELMADNITVTFH